MDVKKIAVQTAKKYQTWNPYEIAEARGIQIIYAPLKSILGYYTKYKRIQCIILNDNIPSHLQRFVCAHELGHSICHADLNTQWLRKNTLVSTDRIEREASTFAVELLLPDDFILEYSNYSLKSLGKMVGIPTDLCLLKKFDI